MGPRPRTDGELAGIREKIRNDVAYCELRAPKGQCCAGEYTQGGGWATFHRLVLCSGVSVLSYGLGGWRFFGNTRQDDWLPIWKFGDKGEVSSHGLDIAPQRGDQEVAALFDLRDAFLSNAQGLGDLLLRELARFPNLPERHFLSNELGCAGLDLLALRGAQLLDDVIYVPGHGYFLSFFFNRLRCASNRSSALAISRL